MIVHLTFALSLLGGQAEASAVSLPAADAPSAKTLDALARPVAFDFRDTPARDVMAYFSQLAGTEIAPAAGHRFPDLTAAVNGVPLLKVLDDLALAWRAEWAIQDGTILIVPQRQAEELTQVRVYPMPDRAADAGAAEVARLRETTDARDAVFAYVPAARALVLRAPGRTQLRVAQALREGRADGVGDRVRKQVEAAAARVADVPRMPPPSAAAKATTAKLAGLTSSDFAGASLGDATKTFGDLAGLSFDLDDEAPRVALSADDVTTARLLDRMLRPLDRQWSIDEAGTVVVRKTIDFKPTAVTYTPRTAVAADVVRLVEPTLWQRDDCSVAADADGLRVTAPAPTQRTVAALLLALDQSAAAAR